MSNAKKPATLRAVALLGTKKLRVPGALVDVPGASSWFLPDHPLPTGLAHLYGNAVPLATNEWREPTAACISRETAEAWAQTLASLLATADRPDPRRMVLSLLRELAAGSADMDQLSSDSAYLEEAARLEKTWFPT